MNNKNKPDYLAAHPIPGFAGSPKNGKRVFKATPLLINSHNCKTVHSNVIVVVISFVMFITGLVHSVLSGDNDSDTIRLCGNIIVFTSLVAALTSLISTPYAVSSYSRKMSEIYLEINQDGIKGISLNEFNGLFFFDIRYGDIKRIACNSSQIGFYLRDGRYINYNVFYNPHEIYSAIKKITDKQSDFAQQTV